MTLAQATIPRNPEPRPPTSASVSCVARYNHSGGADTLLIALRSVANTILSIANTLPSVANTPSRR